MDRVEIYYEVKRFNQWWKNSYIINIPLKVNERPWFNMDYLYERAYKNDLWEIRNLTFKEK